LAQHGLCIHRIWGISKSPQTRPVSNSPGHKKKRAPPQHPAWGRYLMFAKPQMVLVIFLGLSRSSDLTQCWGAGCATGPRGTGALPSSNGCAIPLLEGLKPISLSILQWAAEWPQCIPTALPQDKRVPLQGGASMWIQGCPSPEGRMRSHRQSL